MCLEVVPHLTSAGFFRYNWRMKIKKPMKKPAGGEGAGGAAIADRFKLEPVDTTAPRHGYISKSAATTALVFGLIAFVITVTLTVMIYKHWEFLRFA